MDVTPMQTKTIWTLQRRQELDARRRAATERLVARISDVNRERVRIQCEESRGKLHKETSIGNFAQACLKADQALGGRDFRQLTVDDARRIITSFRACYSPNSLRTKSIHFRMHIRWLFEVDRLDEQGSPCANGKAIERALNVPRPRGHVVGQVISREHQDLLVESLLDAHSLNPPFPLQVRDRWFLRGLKALGHRISEFCSVQLRGVRFQLMTAQAWSFVAPNEANFRYHEVPTVYLNGWANNWKEAEYCEDYAEDLSPALGALKVATTVLTLPLRAALILGGLQEAFSEFVEYGACGLEIFDEHRVETPQGRIGNGISVGPKYDSSISMYLQKEAVARAMVEAGACMDRPYVFSTATRAEWAGSFTTIEDGPGYYPHTYKRDPKMDGVWTDQNLLFVEQEGDCE